MADLQFSMWFDQRIIPQLGKAARIGMRFFLLAAIPGANPGVIATADAEFPNPEVAKALLSGALKAVASLESQIAVVPPINGIKG
ncbi:MAG: hypothetical protein ACREQE_08765 [Candidatus Binataceae bacterium]